MVLKIASTYSILYWLTIFQNCVSWSLPKTICDSPFILQDVSKATTVVGNGTPGSCIQAVLESALLRGGIITFNCGQQPMTIPISNELQIAKDKDTIIDGNGLITLDGMQKTRIMRFDRGDFRYATPILTIQRLRFINGQCHDIDGGCAIFQKNGGTTLVIDSSFENNTGPTVGQDVAGGAIWTIGGGETTIVRSVFRNNSCSNGGGLGILGSGLQIYNSLFQNNRATGFGGNPGNGGNGGAISFDGRGRNNIICGTRFMGNQANKYGGAFFRVSYNGNETNNFDHVMVDSNFITEGEKGLAGGLYIQGGTASITNSVIANNSADGAGGLFLADEKLVTLSRVDFLENRAYTGLAGAIFCSSPVTGVFSSLNIANNHAGAFSAAFSFCSTTITLSNSIIANNTVGNPWPSNACNTMMNGGTGIIQAPVNKQSPASGPDSFCANNNVLMTNNVSIVIDKSTWTVKVLGVNPVNLGLSIMPGL